MRTARIKCRRRTINVFLEVQELLGEQNRFFLVELEDKIAIPSRALWTQEVLGNLQDSAIKSIQETGRDSVSLSSLLGELMRKQINDFWLVCSRHATLKAWRKSTPLPSWTLQKTKPFREMTVPKRANCPYPPYGGHSNFKVKRLSSSKLDNNTLGNLQ